MTLAGEDGSASAAASTKAAAWETWGPIAPGPRNPSARLFAKTASTPAISGEAMTESARRSEHHVTTGVFALRPRGHTINLVDRIVDDLSVCR